MPSTATFSVQCRIKAELDAIEARGKVLNIKAPVSFRVSPDIDRKPIHISTGLQQHKFGVGMDERCRLPAGGIAEPGGAVGISYHIGSQVTSLKPFVESTERVLSWWIN
jgi:diaminopimelate decarboxylase